VFGLSPLNAVLIIWGVVTAALVLLLIYRSTISMKEDEQLFLDPAQSNMEQEQREVRLRLEKITPYTTILGVTSGVLLAVSAGLWVYEQFTKTSY
jgi:Tfp pilus assembly protein PilN